MLFSPFSLKKLSLRNRIVMPPMCMYMAGRDGLPNDWHATHYASRAVGQVGLIIVEATGVEDRGRISARDLGLWNDAQRDGLKKIVELVHAQGASIAIQLNHAGRKSEVEYLEPVAPSALPFSEEYRVPKSLSVSEIREIVAHFAAAARRAVEAGFDAIEIHGAHGYLINQFMSPLVNQRTDEYGGSSANRGRLLGEVLEAVKAVTPADMPVWVRVSAEEYEPQGNGPETVAEIINQVKAKGLDAVHVSSGGVTSFRVKAYPGYQVDMARRIKAQTGLPVIGGGLVTGAREAEHILKADVDLVFLGRELLRNPYWPLQAAGALGEEIAWPEPYLRGK